MGQTRKPVRRASGGSTSDRAARDETIAAKYRGSSVAPPCFRAGRSTGRPRSEPSDRASGQPARPFRELIEALRASATAVPEPGRRRRASGMDRAAIYKLEIGLNSNPTHATLTRYANALWNADRMASQDDSDRRLKIAQYISQRWPASADRASSR